MAERNNLRIADRGEVSNEDPFAELTRIMGFDPRQPVGSENEVAAQSASADHLGEDDLSLDLEKELLGEFSIEDSAIEQPYEAAAYEPAAYEPSGNQPASTVTDQPFEHDAPTAHDYSEDELAASFEQEFAVDTSWQTPPVDARPYADNTEVEAVSYSQEASDFDSALAEVDMDFGSSLPPFEGNAEFEPAELEIEDHYQVDAPAPVAAAPVAEMSLEDELNALLGNMDPARGEQPSPVAYSAPQTIAPEPAFDPAELNFSEDDLVFDQPALEAGHFETPQEQPVYVSSHYEDDTASELDQNFAYDAEEQPVFEEPANFEHANYVDYAATTQPEATFDAPEAVEEAELDPLEELAALTNYTPQDTHVWSRQTPTQYYNEPVAHEPVAEAPVAAVTHYVDEQDDVAPLAATSDSGIPDIETIDVPEQAIALADDLDLPELAHEEDVPQAAAYDDLDAEFANLLNDMNPTEPEAPVATVAAQPDTLDDFGSDFDLTLDDDLNAAPATSSQYAYAAAGAAAGAGAYAAGNAYARSNPAAQASGTAADPYANFATDDFFGGNSTGGYQQGAADELGYDPALDEEMALPEYQEVRPEPKRRGLMIAALVGGVAILGGVGALAFSFGGGSGSDAPAIVRADDSPIKVRPENPGGTTIPNQDSKVYESVARSGPQTNTPANNGPTQEQLVTTAEEPVDITARANEEAEDAMPLGDDENLPGVAMKSEDRLQPTEAGADNTAANEVAAVAPRKVRTMVVRPDGSLVPREEPLAAPAQTADSASEGVLAPVASNGDTTASTSPALAPQPSNNAPAAMPSTMEAAPSRPANQPVNVVGEVQPQQQVAAVAPTAAAGAWAMQIASQPSEAAAQSSYQDLSRRYSSVLNGRQPSIVKAEIEGRGTFWRVRIPAQTRNEAVTLCESYKAAGGNCFVSR